MDSLASTSSREGSSGQFDWPVAWEGESILRKHVETFLEQNSAAAALAERMRNETATDFFEWIDHLVLPLEHEPALQAAGFTRASATDTPGGERVYEHRPTTLPRVVLRPGPSLIALRPEFVADFAARQQLGICPEGNPFSRYRRLTVSLENGTRLEAVERRAYRGFNPAPLPAAELEKRVATRELWATRRREFAEAAEGFAAAERILNDSVELVGPDLSCQFFFEAERAYWESRNQAARFQKHRQDLLGLGWGNHDHHTFRCSRRHFLQFVQFLLKLGFVKRERYYAGAEAGWGAQILEHPLTGIVVFADVDLMPEETQVDFSTSPLPPAHHLGTVGLWVGLHGESFLEAGMHHLEARFDFALLREQLRQSGLAFMKPFSDFEFLRQAFTEGERWPVREDRARRLLNSGLITREQFERFLREGSIGSHLENLQRRGGFKGFNQKSVSAVIKATDPRAQPANAPARGA